MLDPQTHFLSHTTLTIAILSEIGLPSLAAWVKLLSVFAVTPRGLQVTQSTPRRWNINSGALLTQNLCHYQHCQVNHLRIRCIYSWNEDKWCEVLRKNLYHKSALNHVYCLLSFSVGVYVSWITLQQCHDVQGIIHLTPPAPPPSPVCDVFLITLKYDGGRLRSSVSLTMAPLAAETYITLIGSNGCNICHHVAFMDQQRRLLKINTGIARWDRRVLRSLGRPMTVAFWHSSFCV